MTFVTPKPYIGHLGLDGVGDTKSMMEREMRQRYIKWITNARTASLEPGIMHIDEIAADGSVAATQALPFRFSMMLPAFRGVPAIFGIAGLTNPRGFVLIEAREPTKEATWNALCLADFGDEGVAFVAQPQIPPRNVNWSAQGKWVHLAKVAFEKYFLRKVRKGESQPFYERLALKVIGLSKLKN